MGDLSPAAVDLLLHTTGLRPDGPEPGRNRLVCTADHPGLSELLEAGLVEGLGWWALAASPAWRASAAGLAEAQQLAKALAPRLSRAQRRYLAWLVVGDVYPVSFGDFLRKPEWAEARR